MITDLIKREAIALIDLLVLNNKNQKARLQKIIHKNKTLMNSKISRIIILLILIKDKKEKLTHFQ